MSELIRLLGLARPYAGWLALGVFASLVTLLANVTLMALSGWFIAAMALAGVTGASLNYFTPAALIRACAILRTGGRYGERLATHDAILRLLSHLRLWTFERLEPLAPAGLMAQRGGDLLSRIGADIDTLDEFYLRVLVPVLTALFAVALIGLALWTFDAGLALLLVSLLVLGGVLIPALGRLGARRAVHDQVRQAARLRALAVEGLQGMAELLALGGERRLLERLETTQATLARAQRRGAAVAAGSRAALGLSAQLAVWFALWLAIPLVRDGGLAPPELSMVALLSLAAFEAVTPLPAAFESWDRTLTAARRVFGLTDRPLPVPPPTGPSPIPGDNGIRIRDLAFRYAPDAPWVFEGLDLDIPAGLRLGIRGPSGCGKSTLAHLLLRFHDPDRGHIELGGHDLRRYHGEDLYRRITLVSQQTRLFTGTLGDNLRLARPEATPEELAAACRAARLEAFIDALPEGYDTWIGEAGLRLSGGQMRRLTVARALLREAPVLILDEPTEGLDALTERDLLDALGALPRDRTLILIAHRRVMPAWLDTVLDLEDPPLRRGRPESPGS